MSSPAPATQQLPVAPGVRDELALACRILARNRVVEGSLGHVSARHGEALLIRGRGPGDTGLMDATAEDVLLCGRDGRVLEASDRRPPSELPLHAEILAARPDVAAVVHAHPPAVLACDLAGVPLVPVFGAYNIPAARLVRRPPAVFAHPWLIDSEELGAAVARALGAGTVCVLRGHGVVVAGASVRQATMRCLDLEAVARTCLAIAHAGAVPQAISDADLDRLPDLGPAFDDDQTWRHHAAADHKEQA